MTGDLNSDWMRSERIASAVGLVTRALRDILAESAGVEPARPFGLVALAPRCLAARPTLREPGALLRQGFGGHPAFRVVDPAKRAARSRMVGEAGIEPAACGIRIRRAANCATPPCATRRARRVDHALIADVITPRASRRVAWSPAVSGIRSALLQGVGGHPASRVALDPAKRVAGSSMVRAAGFEPATAWFQARSAAGLRYALMSEDRGRTSEDR